MKTYTDKALNQLLSNFRVPSKDYLFKPLTDGFINDTFLVFDGSKPLYIFQRVNHKVFTNVEGLMNNVRNAFQHLTDEDYREIVLVKTQDGGSFYKHKNGETCYWRTMTYINGSTAYNTTTDPKVAFEAGKIIGKFNILLQQANPDDYIDTIPKFHDLGYRKAQFQAALKSGEKTKLDTAQSAITFAHRVLKELSNEALSNLPIRICHNDTKLNNILFSKKTQKALCLIDLDTLMRGHFHYDFGDAVRTIVNTAPEDEQEHEKITFEKKLFEAFVDGLAANENFLSNEEVKAMPWGAILMPFLHGLRALTDYLNGNVYYKVAYENQNLDRCLSLFSFTQKALENKAYMEEIVQEKLS
ncbi:phosphotransferase enzyme family protein [Pareuzebyella sediminis]|uniref:phosphotransferase enzyme family protein n=1 Tax=Pareuzebyella sediminis TaxID=2607998 RepID=UPI0011EE42F6|nr:aminoglycoside phosphotransferase family protein [Pareuzebyella sediminis]